MRNLLFLSIISIGLLSCNRSKKKPSANNFNKSDSSYRITSYSAGPFNLGELTSDVLNNFDFKKKIETRHAEDGVEKRQVYTVEQNGEKLIILYSEFNIHTNSFHNTIDEMMIVSPVFKTKKGIGVGSTIQEFADKYPEYELWYTYVSDHYILENKVGDVQFLLAEKDFIGKMKPIRSEKMPLEAKDFKDGTQIYKIRIY